MQIESGTSHGSGAFERIVPQRVGPPATSGTRGRVKEASWGGEGDGVLALDLAVCGDVVAFVVGLFLCRCALVLAHCVFILGSLLVVLKRRVEMGGRDTGVDRRRRWQI